MDRRGFLGRLGAVGAATALPWAVHFEKDAAPLVQPEAVPDIITGGDLDDFEQLVQEAARMLEVHLDYRQFPTDHLTPLTPSDAERGAPATTKIGDSIGGRIVTDQFGVSIDISDEEARRRAPDHYLEPAMATLANTLKDRTVGAFCVLPLPLGVEAAARCITSRGVVLRGIRDYVLPTTSEGGNAVPGFTCVRFDVLFTREPV